jgi:hypothetical protein
MPAANAPTARTPLPSSALASSIGTSGGSAGARPTRLPLPRVVRPTLSAAAAETIGASTSAPRAARAQITPAARSPLSTTARTQKPNVHLPVTRRLFLGDGDDDDEHTEARGTTSSAPAAAYVSTPASVTPSAPAVVSSHSLDTAAVNTLSTRAAHAFAVTENGNGSARASSAAHAGMSTSLLDSTSDDDLLLVPAGAPLDVARVLEHDDSELLAAAARAFVSESAALPNAAPPPIASPIAPTLPTVAPAATAPPRAAASTTTDEVTIVEVVQPSAFEIVVDENAGHGEHITRTRVNIDRVCSEPEPEEW